jgi:antitoxin component YwqK of YwqJK toxin-antitoxin module
VSKPEATCPDGTTRREQARVDLSVDSMRKNRFVVQCERKDGTPHGPFRELYPGKTVEREGTYNGGKIDGQVRWYHDTGELFRERTYKNGTPTGTWIDYSSGKKSFQTEYDASGNKTLTRSLHANGKPKTETDFAKDGAWLRMRRYDETGTLTSTEEL